MRKKELGGGCNQATRQQASLSQSCQLPPLQGCQTNASNEALTKKYEAPNTQDL